MSFTFIDLFAGIGGFHQAMTNLGGKCLLASEIDPNCIQVYKNNYQIDSGIDIKNLNEKNVPIHDLLCAGFPCQAFSKAGKQEGLNDTRGTLFFEIERIIKFRHPKYIILENVRNLTSHDNGNTWRIIKNNLKLIGYRLTENPLILSPHQFGVPQLRERVYILGIYDPRKSHVPLEIHFEKLKKKNDNSIYSIIEAKDNNKLELQINSYEKLILQAWDEFYRGLDKKTIGFPIWSQYFNQNKIDDTLPEWKKDFIRKNQSLFLANKLFIKKWLNKYNNLKEFVPTHRKFEWQAGTSINTIWDGLIQFRPSGIRVKKPDVAPTLVAMVQIPIIGKFKRRLSIKECAKLQSFSDDFKPDKNPLLAYKQFGNSVNVRILEELGKKLFEI